VALAVVAETSRGTRRGKRSARRVRLVGPDPLRSPQRSLGPSLGDGRSSGRLAAGMVVKALSVRSEGLRW